MLGVAAPHDVGGSAEVGRTRRRPRSLGVAVDLDGDLRHPLAQVQGREPARVAGQLLEDTGACLVEPGVAVGGEPGQDHVLGQPLALCLRDPRRRTPPSRRQEVAGKHEERASHRELLDQRPVLEESPVYVGDAQRGHPRPERQVDGRGLGRVQHGHRPGRQLGGVGLGSWTQGMTPREAGAALLVADVTHRHILPSSAILRTAGRRHPYRVARPLAVPNPQEPTVTNPPTPPGPDEPTPPPPGGTPAQPPYGAPAPPPLRRGSATGLRAAPRAGPAFPAYGQAAKEPGKASPSRRWSWP